MTKYEHFNPGQIIDDNLDSITGGVNYYIHGDDLKLMANSSIPGQVSSSPAPPLGHPISMGSFSLADHVYNPNTYEHYQRRVRSRKRYAAGAQAAEAKLCCPVEYNAEYLKVIPQEVIERDYGCGDPSKYLREGETVLDLGSGTGKICFIAAQVVGPEGESHRRGYDR